MNLKNLLMTAFLVCCSQFLLAEGNSDEELLLIGSYAPAETEGLALYSLNEETADVKRISGMKGILNPSYLMPCKEKGLIYVVGQGSTDDSYAHSVALNPSTGKMTLLDSEKTGSPSPCHIRLAPKRTHIITANYEGGSLSVFSLKNNGRIDKLEQVLQFKGKGIDPIRQEQTHLHFSIFSPDGKYLLADDLGTDIVYSFPVENNKAFLNMNTRIDNKVTDGSGPRHLCFHPNGKWAYLINELAGTVIFLKYKDGKLEMQQTIRSEEVSAQGSGDIHISPDGKFLYSSNRLKHDGLAIFAVSQSDGKLTKVGYQLTGKHPRNFMITKNGKYLFVACRDDNVVQIFKRNMENGKLTDTGKTIKMSKPVCLRIYE